MYLFLTARLSYLIYFTTSILGHNNELTQEAQLTTLSRTYFLFIPNATGLKYHLRSNNCVQNCQITFKYYFNISSDNVDILVYLNKYIIIQCSHCTNALSKVCRTKFRNVEATFTPTSRKFGNVWCI